MEPPVIVPNRALDEEGIRYHSQRIVRAGRVLLVCSVSGIVISGLLWWTLPDPPSSGDPTGIRNGYDFRVATSTYFAVGANLITAIGGIAMIRRENYQVVVLMLTVALIPCNAVYPVMLPVVGWCFYVISRPGAAQAFKHTSSSPRDNSG
ncbi:MAG TPA: hypothetical protein DDW52_08720 [Planctomycetaceae bacterium]|nr:hypothetical protein [Planctomycetaceae bacterium]